MFLYNIFTSLSARSARTAGPKIALRFPRLFVCLFVRTRGQYITSYVTMQLQYMAVFGDLQVKQQTNEGSCVLSRWRKLGWQP